MAGADQPIIRDHSIDLAYHKLNLCKKPWLLGAKAQGACTLHNKSCMSNSLRMWKFCLC